MPKIKDNRPVLLCILDGFGIGSNEEPSYNAVKMAHTPCLDKLLKNFPHTELQTSGTEVGLPKGQMGNSEVGHVTIGSGRIILQDLPRINQAISNRELESHPLLKKLTEFHNRKGKTIHLLGLCSDGGVHSHIEHFIFLARLLANNKLNIRLHLFLDGRDTAPNSASIYLNRIEKLCEKYSNIKIATVAGRFYAMDRDQRWERTKLAYFAIGRGLGNKFSNSQDYLNEQYQENISDEFIIPAIAESYQGIEDGDSVIFTNFRSDRIKQIAEILVKESRNLSYKIGMTNYSKTLDMSLECLFPELPILNTLGEIISLEDKSQLRIAETEKYAHVTFFFNGGREEPYINEDRILIQSPNVSTYDLKPEMSSFELTEELIHAMNNKSYDLIVINYANGDMVGHSGKIDPTIKAIESLDKCLEQIYLEIKKNNGILIITADHGNAEYMFNTKTNSPHTSHTSNPVPFILVSNEFFQSNLKLEKGNLSDIAPTILKIMNINKPVEMTGKSLIGI